MQIRCLPHRPAGFCPPAVTLTFHKPAIFSFSPAFLLSCAFWSPGWPACRSGRNTTSSLENSSGIRDQRQHHWRCTATVLNPVGTVRVAVRILHLFSGSFGPVGSLDAGGRRVSQPDRDAAIRFAQKWNPLLFLHALLVRIDRLRMVSSTAVRRLRRPLCLHGIFSWTSDHP